MKTKQLLKESLIWVIIAIPFVYFAVLYPHLPGQIPIHFDIHGNPDNYASKATYWWLIGSMTIGLYLIMLIIPLIDPKGKIKQMGNKYYILKLILVGLMALLSIISVYVAANPKVKINFLIMITIGLMFLIFGNYMPSFKPNYFIGIRTPWTLESEDNWRRTHRMGGWLWAITGLVVIILTLVGVNALVSIILLTIAAFTPLVYSFIIYLEDKKKHQ